MIASVITTARKQRRLSLGALAERAGVHKSTLSRWESGKTTPFVVELERVLDALDVPEATRRTCWQELGVPRAERRLAASEAPALTGGELLRALRQRTRRTQADAARAAGVTQTLLSRWESNECAPDAGQLGALCRFLGATKGETIGLHQRDWRRFDEIPEEKEALDAALDAMEEKDTLFDRDLHYLALGSRYQRLYRANRISKEDADGIWGHYANYVCWHWRYDDSAWIAQPVLAQLKGKTAFLTRAEAHALIAHLSVLGAREDEEGVQEILRTFTPRVRPDTRSAWLDMAANIVEKQGDLDGARRYYLGSIEAAGSTRTQRMRRQRFARTLCHHKQYRDALEQLDAGPDTEPDPRVSVVMERDLTYAWALSGLNDCRGADQHLRRAMPLVEANPFEDLKDMARQIARRIAA